MNFSTIWVIASFSFVVALSGALVPGPLLTYTIMKTLEVKKKGFSVGALVIAGHAILESVLVILLLAGFASLLKSDLTVRIIGAVGGALLVYLGGRLVFDLLKGRVQNVFLNTSVGKGHGEPIDDIHLDGEASSPRKDPASGGGKGTVPAALRKLPHPVVGGILVSMSNPYWWIWWASIGFAFMAQYDINFGNPTGLLSFMIGHEAGDLAVYWLVSILVALGRRRMNDRIYRVVLFVCAAVMIGFGLFLGIKPYF